MDVRGSRYNSRIRCSLPRKYQGILRLSPPSARLKKWLFYSLVCSSLRYIFRIQALNGTDWFISIWSRLRTFAVISSFHSKERLGIRYILFCNISHSWHFGYSNGSLQNRRYVLSFSGERESHTTGVIFFASFLSRLTHAHLRNAKITPVLQATQMVSITVIT